MFGDKGFEEEGSLDSGAMTHCESSENYQGNFSIALILTESYPAIFSSAVFELKKAATHNTVLRRKCCQAESISEMPRLRRKLFIPAEVLPTLFDHFCDPYSLATVSNLRSQ